MRHDIVPDAIADYLLAGTPAPVCAQKKEGAEGVGGSGLVGKHRGQQLILFRATLTSRSVPAQVDGSSLPRRTRRCGSPEARFSEESDAVS